MATTMTSTLKPSNFLRHPYGSVMQNCEHETIARNIMVILKRTGDEWRTLSWDEYLAERAKDGEGNFSRERPYFDRVAGFCVAPESAEAFAPGWGRQHRARRQGGGAHTEGAVG